MFDGPEQTAVFWDSCDPRMREFMALTTPAPLIIVPFAHEQAYVDRYLQPDKAATARQSGADFPAPYWYIDAAFAAMLVLLGAIDERLGAFYFSVAPNRKGVETFVERVGVPSGYWPIGAIAIGYPSEDEAPPTPGTTKPHRRDEARLHMGKW